MPDVKQIEFGQIESTASLHKGGRAALMAMLPLVKSRAELISAPDSYYLSTMTRRIFQAGLKHSLVNDRWPAFEQAFEEFEPHRLMMMSDDELDQHMANTRLIRHLGKMKSIRLNAAMIVNVARECGGFGQFLAEWKETEIVELWRWLKKHGNQLGGMSGPRFLRLVGKDTFLLTDDVVAVLKSLGVVEKMPSAKADLHRVQALFNEWHQQTGMPYSHLSRIVSCAANAS